MPLAGHSRAEPRGSTAPLAAGSQAAGTRSEARWNTMAKRLQWALRGRAGMLARPEGLRQTAGSAVAPACQGRAGSQEEPPGVELRCRAARSVALERGSTVDIPVERRIAEALERAGIPAVPSPRPGQAEEVGILEARANDQAARRRGGTGDGRAGAQPRVQRGANRSPTGVVGEPAGPEPAVRSGEDAGRPVSPLPNRAAPAARLRGCLRARCFLSPGKPETARKPRWLLGPLRPRERRSLHPRPDLLGGESVREDKSLLALPPVEHPRDSARRARSTGAARPRGPPPKRRPTALALLIPAVASWSSRGPHTQGSPH